MEPPPPSYEEVVRKSKNTVVEACRKHAEEGENESASVNESDDDKTTTVVENISATSSEQYENMGYAGPGADAPVVYRDGHVVELPEQIQVPTEMLSADLPNIEYADTEQVRLNDCVLDKLM